MRLLKALRELFAQIKAAKQEAADLLRLNEEIRHRKIRAAEDLDHAYLGKLIAAMNPGTEVRIFLASGETVEIVKPDRQPAQREGPGW